MDRLKELQSLINLSKALNQEPDIALLEEKARLEKRQNKIKKNIENDLKEIFNPKVEPVVITRAIAPISNPDVFIDIPVLEGEETQAQRLIDEKEKTNVERVAETIKETVVSQGEPLLVPKPQDPLAKKVDLLEKWISRIAATGPGGGAAQIYNLDMPVKTVTTDYTIGRKDYYVGVSSSVKTYITLPDINSNLKDGRVVVVKDESGHAQLTPIAIVGTIDGDVNGAEIRINNGALQFIYRNGSWRII